MKALTVHRLSRELEGAIVMLPLPLCWDAPERAKPNHDDEDWWTGWDQGALDPTRLVFATTDEAVTCLYCLEWMHA